VLADSKESFALTKGNPRKSTSPLQPSAEESDFANYRRAGVLLVDGAASAEHVRWRNLIVGDLALFSLLRVSRDSSPAGKRAERCHLYADPVRQLGLERGSFLLCSCRGYLSGENCGLRRASAQGFFDKRATRVQCVSGSYSTRSPASFFNMARPFEPVNDDS
jgi:hypothetical protein